MHILQKTASAQTLTFIARELYAGDVDVVITDKAERTSNTVSGTTTLDRFFCQLSAVFTLQEDRSFIAKVYKTGGQTEANLLYRGLIFCTNQDVSEYSLNDGVYTVHTTDNEYVIHGDS